MDENDIQVIKDALKEQTVELETQVKDLSTKVETLEAKAVAPAVAKESNIYKGFNLKYQLEDTRELFSDEKSADIIAKSLIDMAISAKAGTPMSIEKAAATHVEGTTTAGGYLVLEEYDRILVKKARENSVMMPLLRQVNLSSTDEFRFNKVNAEVSLSWDAEGTVTEKSTTFTRGTIAVKRLSGRVVISNELLADSAYDLSSELTEQFAYAMAQEIDNQVLNGTGTPCSGVLTAAAGYSTIITGSAWSGVTGDDFSLAMTNLASGDLSNATFVLGKKGSHYVRTLKDSNSNPIYAAIASAELDQLYGIPTVVSNKIDDATGGSGGFYAVLGDFKQFYLLNRLGGLELLVDPYSDSSSYNTQFVFVTRKGLGIRRADSFVRLGTS